MKSSGNLRMSVSSSASTWTEHTAQLLSLVWPVEFLSHVLSLRRLLKLRSAVALEAGFTSNSFMYSFRTGKRSCTAGCNSARLRQHNSPADPSNEELCRLLMKPCRTEASKVWGHFILCPPTPKSGGSCPPRPPVSCAPGRNYDGRNRNWAESHFRGSFGAVTEAVTEIRSASILLPCLW